MRYDFIMISTHGEFHLPCYAILSYALTLRSFTCILEPQPTIEDKVNARFALTVFRTGLDKH